MKKLTALLDFVATVALALFLIFSIVYYTIFIYSLVTVQLETVAFLDRYMTIFFWSMALMIVTSILRYIVDDVLYMHRPICE